jgi:uncharacterized membrane protein
MSLQGYATPQTKSVARYMPTLLLALLIAAYVGYFSWYTINRHNTLNSYTADLSLIDQPMWNTVIGPGTFMELTWGEQQQPRLAEHFEPILVPLAMLFWLWDDVRIQLIAQTVTLALGALPVFWIARDKLRIHNSALTNWAALAFAATYLLFPQLQAANIADFHADPFVVTPLLFAFWYATQQRWNWMWVWAIVAMAAKETLPTLTAMLGVWLLWRYLATGRRQPTAAKTLKHGTGLIITGTLWFMIATFFIVAPLARQYFGTTGPIYFENRYSGGLVGLWPLLQDPARWQYVLGLFAAVGLLPLLAPELLILGLPVLVANLLSNFPGQYSGEQHYSAPLVVAFVLAAIYGTRRLMDNISPREENGQPGKITALMAVVLWLLTWSLAYHALHGWTPLSLRTETYANTPAAARLPDFIRQIPAAAVVSASAAVHPHLSHRRVIYSFPTVQEAAYLLVDVTDIPGVHPYDAHTKIIELLTTNWQLVQADQGLILAQRSAAPNTTPWPDSFYNFARAATLPAQPAVVDFGDGRLQLLGYDVKDDPDDGVTFRFYWQASDTLPEDLHLWPLVYDDTGRLLSNPTQVPMIATVWYPPHQWQPDEIIVTATLPQRLPDVFHLGIAVGPANSFHDPTQRVSISRASQKVRVYPGQWAQLATFKRQGPFLTHLPPVPTLLSFSPADAPFGDSLRLTGFWLDSANLHPGASLPILLQWTAGQSPPTDYTVFVHLIAPDGAKVAQHDTYPAWLTAQPTSQWLPDQPVLDRHVLDLPANLPPGSYTLLAGLYNAGTMERLTLPNGDDTFTLTQIEIK